MAQRLIERACDRFRKEISPEDASEIVSTASIDDVKLALGQIERHLAARQSLRNFDRIAPFLGAAERFSQVVEVVCNGTPYLPWIWAPVKFIIQSARDHAHVLDKLLMAYGNIGTHMPRLSRYAEAFPGDHAFQQMVVYLFEDVLEFHRKAYSMIKKPGWIVFFSSAWGRFEHRFSSLLNNIEQLSHQIDREAVALDIIKTAEQRSKAAVEAAEDEKRWQAQQFHAIMTWLGIEDDIQESKLDMNIRAWLQRNRGNPVLWLNGKPGSGKSILSSMLIRFLRNDPSRRVCFFFCDYNTSSMDIGTQVMRTICSQIIRMAPDLVPYVYDECLGKAQRPSSDVLKKLIPQLVSRFNDIQVIVDGIDEIPPSEHRHLIKSLLLLSSTCTGLKLLLVSQDMPSISAQLSKKPSLRLSEEGEATRKDHAIMVRGSLEELNDDQNGAIPDEVMKRLEKDILEKSEGMFLWVSLVMTLLRMSASMQELQQQISLLPRSLAEVYQKLLNNICNQYSASSIPKIMRVFAWLKCHKGQQPMLKCEVRLGMVLDESTQRITRDTRPFPNATDICKPLIEDGPGNTLVFVHSTVPQFLFESGPDSFMSVPKAVASVTFACICQLDQALELAQTSGLANASTIEIASGLHGLLPYAHQYWIQHLMDFLTSSEQVATSFSAVLMKTLRQLCQKLIRLSNMEKESFVTNDGSELLRRYLNAAEAAVIESIMNRKQQTGSHEQSVARTLTLDPYSSSLEEYHRTVRHVAQQSSVHGIEQNDLIAFKEDYGPGAFVCDWPGCGRMLRGFPSESQLSSHRARHTQTLKCYDKDCAYNDVGFLTERSLKNHKKRMHSTPDSNTKAIPKRLRKTSTPDTPVTPTHTTANFARNELNTAALPNPGLQITAPPATVPVAPSAHPDPNAFIMDNQGSMSFEISNLDFANPIDSGNVLKDFDFDKFLHDGDYGTDSVDFTSNFDMPGGEIATE